MPCKLVLERQVHLQDPKCITWDDQNYQNCILPESDSLCQVTSFGFGSWASISQLISNINTFKVFAKCYQCAGST